MVDSDPSSGNIITVSEKSAYKNQDSKTVSNLSGKKISGSADDGCNQNWMAAVNELSLYEGSEPYQGFISDCIEEIVPLDQIDSYMNEVRRLSQSNVLKSEASFVLSSSTIEKGEYPQKTGNADSNRSHSDKQALQQTERPSEDGIVDLKAERNRELHRSCLPKSLTDGDVDRQSPNRSMVSGSPEVLGQDMIGVNMTPPSLDANPQLEGDPFSDYESDDDTFEAELQQWQKSAVGLLSQTKK